MRLKNILIIYHRQIRHHRLKRLSLIVLFAVAIVMMYMAVFELVKSQYDIMIIKQFFPERERLYNIRVWISDTGEATTIGMQNFLDSLGMIEGVEFGGKFYYTNSELRELKEDEEFLKINFEIVKGTEREEYPSLLQFCYVDRSLTSFLGVEVLSREKHGDMIPVLAGAKYQKILKKGDVYTDNDGCRYRICGILPEGFCFPPELLFGTLVPYENMDDKLIALYDTKVNPFNMYTLSASNSIYCMTDGSEETLERIEKLAKECFIHIKAENIDQTINEYKQQEKTYLQTTILFTGITVLSAFLAMLASSIIHIILEKQEYGVLYANGVSRWDSFRLIALDNGVCQFVAFLFATGLAVKKISEQVIYDNGVYIDIFNRMVIWRVFLIVLILFLISTVIPVILLNHMKTTELLGGNEL